MVTNRSKPLFAVLSECTLYSSTQLRAASTKIVAHVFAQPGQVHCSGEFPPRLSAAGANLGTGSITLISALSAEIAAPPLIFGRIGRLGKPNIYSVDGNVSRIKGRVR
jgi:hypothetical protein